MLRNCSAVMRVHCVSVRLWADFKGSSLVELTKQLNSISFVTFHSAAFNFWFLVFIYLVYLFSLFSIYLKQSVYLSKKNYQKCILWNEIGTWSAVVDLTHFNLFQRPFTLKNAFFFPFTIRNVSTNFVGKLLIRNWVQI